MTEGRINVHLHERKQLLMELHPGHGELSRIVRVLIESYLEGRIMHLSPEISTLLSEKDKTPEQIAKDSAEAVELITNDLVALRQRRVQAGQRASKKRSRAKTQKAKDKAGIKSPERQQADKMVEDMLKMQESQETTIEFAGGEADEDRMEKSSERQGTEPTAKKKTRGTARKVDRKAKR